MILGCENIAPGIGLTGSWSDNAVMRSDGDQDNASFQGSDIYIDDNSYVGIGAGASSPCSQLEVWDDNAHPILSITAAHDSGYDPQAQFRTDVTDTVKCSLGVDSGDSDKLKIYMGEGIGGTSQFVFTSAGHFGIGEISPETILEIMSTAPIVTLHNSTESDTDGSRACTLQAFGEQSGGEKTTLGKIVFAHDGNNDDQKADILFYGNKGADGDSPTEIARWASSGDFSFKGNNSTFAIRVDFNGAGDIPAGSYYYPTGTNDNFTLLTNANGTVGSIVTGCAYNGSAWRSMFEYRSVSSGEPNLILAKTAGNVGIGETSPETILEITSTIPYITLHNSTESDVADSGMSILWFSREQSGGEETHCAAIKAAHDSAADDQKGYLGFFTNSGTDDDAPTLRMKIDSAGLVDVVGNFTAGTIQADNGFTGSFVNGDGDTVTVVGGIITDIS